MSTVLVLGMNGDDCPDYAGSGHNIQSAMQDWYKRSLGRADYPNYILWNGLKVKTGDWWSVPRSGRIRVEFVGWKNDVEQGVDVKIDKGSLAFADGTKIPLLRTWADPALNPVVEYPYNSRTGRLLVYNVFKREDPHGLVDEKWTGNAGFWVEEVSEFDRIYHCSHGLAPEPDFDLLTFRVRVLPADSPDSRPQG